MAALSARSQTLACAVTPRSPISADVASRAVRPRAQIDTAAPAPANPSAIDRPMPLLPPATTARLPLRLICTSFSSRTAPRRARGSACPPPSSFTIQSEASTGITLGVLIANFPSRLDRRSMPPHEQERILHLGSDGAIDLIILLGAQARRWRPGFSGQHPAYLSAAGRRHDQRRHPHTA